MKYGIAALATFIIATAGAGAQEQSPAGATPPDDVRTRSRMSDHGPYRSRMRVLRDSASLAEPPDAAQLLQSLGDDTYARALVLRRLAHDDAASDNLDSAIARLEEAFQLEALASPAQQQMAINLARLYASAGRFADAVTLLEPWVAAHPETGADLRFTLGLAMIRSGREADGAAQVLQAIRRSESPPEDWFRVALYGQLQAGDYRNASVTLQQLVTRAPNNPDHWLQWGTVLRAAGDAERAVAVLEMATTRGLLIDAAGQQQLVQAYLAAGLPYDAAQLLQHLMDRGAVNDSAETSSLLANAWLAAREPGRAVAPMLAAANGDNTGLGWLAAAQLQMQQQQWDGAVSSLKRARGRDDLGPRSGEVLVLLGEAHYESGNPRAARRAFSEALKMGVVYRQAQVWLDFLDARNGDLP